MTHHISYEVAMAVLKDAFCDDDAAYDMCPEKRDIQRSLRRIEQRLHLPYTLKTYRDLRRHYTRTPRTSKTP